MAAPAFSLSPEQLDDLQGLLKDWLRQFGRTQADLRRALRAGSIRMPVLIEELHRTYAARGRPVWPSGSAASKPSGWRSHPRTPPEPRDSLEDSMGQLDLLLQEIRGENGG